MSLFTDSWSNHLEVSAPSIDRPFGVHLWPLFCYFCNSVLGWNPEKFDFVHGDPTVPYTSLQPVLMTIATYYAVIFGGREIMRMMSPIRINFVFQLHNLFLTALSLTLLVLLVEQLLPILVREGLMYAICNSGSWTQPIVTLYYLNYLTKFYELLDTVFLVLRKKPLTFLHTFHHGATALLCYTQLVGHTSVSWVPIVLNLFVHVVMYWYYFLAACKIRVWWKEWVTRIQIVQFIIDLFFVYFASYTYFTYNYWPHMPNLGNCAGEEFAAISGCAILTSYLFLFIAFYIRVYSKSKSKTKAQAVEEVVNKTYEDSAFEVSSTSTGLKAKSGMKSSTTRSRKS